MILITTKPLAPGKKSVGPVSFDSRSRPDSVAVGLSSVGYRRTSAAIRARGLHAPTAPKFMEITLSPKNGRPSNLVHEVDQSFTRS